MPDSAHLQDLPIQEIRSRRAALVAEETGISYLRRMVQGPLDIIGREQELRAEGTTGNLAALVDDLPSVLADRPRATGPGRLSQDLEPHQIDPELEAELEAIIARGGLLAVVERSDEELVAVASELAGFERRISDRRRDLHRRIDSLQAELTRRYQSGEASVDSLLS